MSTQRNVLAAACVAALIAAPAPAGAQEPLVTTFPVPSPRDVKTGYGSVWLANGPARTVTRIDPRTDAVIARIAVPDPASVIAVGAGAIWLTSLPGNSLTRIDPRTNAATQTISLAPGGAGPVGVTVFRGFVWVANHRGEPTTSVAKVDPATMRVVDVIPVGQQTAAGPQWIVSGAGSIWTNVTSDPAVVVRIDPRTDRILATIPAPGACAEMAADDRAVWAGSSDDPACPPGVTRIDPRTNTVTATITEGGAVNAVALHGGTLWYGTTASHLLGRVDVATNRVRSLTPMPGPAFGMSVGGGAVWTTDAADELLIRVRRSAPCRR
jgi:streptogramin lyase